MQQKPPAKQTIKWGIIDLGVLAFFLLYSLAFFLGRWKGLASFEFLESDIANSAGMAAAKLSPALFKGDALLGDPANIQFYHVIQTPLLHFVYSFTKNFGVSAIILLIPHVFLQLSGFYILGRVLFNNRLWSLFLAALTAQYVHLNLGDFWGLYSDIMPRFLFQALLPFFLAAAVYWRNSPKSWPFILFLFGPMMYTHPVSTPACAFAIWLGFWAHLPSEWSWGKKLGCMFLCGIAFLASASPFLLNYLGSHQHGKTVDFQAVMEIMKWRFDPDFFNIPKAIRGHFQLGFKSSAYFYGVLSVPVLLAVKLYRKERLNKFFSLILWVIGLSIISMAFPYIEQEVCKIYEIAPLEVDLVRNIRYLVPLFQIFFLWTLFEISRSRYLNIPVVLIAAFVSLQHHGPIEDDPIRDTAKAWTSGILVPSPSDTEIAAMHNIQAVRDFVPENSLTLVTHGVPELAVRYSALRPMVYCYKDGGSFAYSNHERLIEWAEETREFKDAFNDADPLYSFYKFAKSLNAEYMIVGFDMKGEKLVNSQAQEFIETIFESRYPIREKNKVRTFAILKLTKKTNP